MRHGSLFSGIGGFDLAAQWMGWENVFHCEWNEFGQKVLKHYWPDAELFTDIIKSDFKKYHGTIDIISGGFPCQPYSTAGKRLGKEDDRHLWPEMLRAIREISPRWVVGENVLGLVNWSDGLVFHEVQTDLEAAGYEVFPYVLPAAAVNAPHRRDRIWFVAHANRGRMQESILQHADISSRSIRNYQEIAQNTISDGRLLGESIEEGAEVRQQWDLGAGDTERICGEKMAGVTADTDSDGFNQRNGKHEEQSSEGWKYAFGNIDESNDDGDAADTANIGRKDALENGKLEGGRFGQSYKRNAWDTFPSVSPICTGDDGISDRLDSITFSKWRNESIKAAGNAICPQVVYQIFKAIEQYEKLP